MTAPYLVNDLGQTIPLMDIAEFRKLGFLQEVNRRFLHPLGLYLYIALDPETGEETLGGIGDYRTDPEGMFFCGPGMREDQEKLQRRARMVRDFRESKTFERMNRIGICFDPRGVDPDEEVPALCADGIQPLNWYPLPPERGDDGDADTKC